MMAADASNETSNEQKRRSVLLQEMSYKNEDSIFLASKSLKRYFKAENFNKEILFGDEHLKSQPSSLGIDIDYDYLNIYDGNSTDAPLIAHLYSAFNDFKQNFNGRVFNAKSNHLFLKFHSAKSSSSKEIGRPNSIHQGFNLTYQIKGLCIEDQISCNSIYELNCYSPNQTCNDVWDCQNGADERGCGPCKSEQFRCKNHIFCYRLEDRCDGYHQCIDYSDELDCSSWFCNSKNGTFLCNNGQCVYEQWVCDGTNDCRDGSDERNCPTPFTRRVITTAVLGGTLCCLLLVMALGCACKLYTLHTVGYRNNIRLSQTVQSAAVAAAAAPLLSSINSQVPTIPNHQSSSSGETNSESSSTRPLVQSTSSNSNSFFNSNIGSFFRSSFLNTPATGSTNNSLNSTNAPAAEQPSTNSNRTANSNGNPPSSGYQFNFATNPSGNNVSSNSSNVANGANLQSGELPLPHHLIAPPTYNQTMGLVDEYEQRQLAFIEHVRSILAQQQHQNTNGSSNGTAGLNLISLNNSNLNQNSLSALTLIPTVTSSSTTVHRVTNSGRRSHSGRHHRHHHHHRSSSSYVDPNSSSSAGTNTNLEQLNNVANLNSGSASGSSSRPHNRMHRHHHRHNHSHLRNQNNNNIHHQITNNLTQVNFDANRRGLMIQHPEAASTISNCSPSSQQANYLRTSSAASTTSSASNKLTATPNSSSLATNSASANEQTTTATTSNNSSATHATGQTNKTTSVNLRDKIAKLIKDIVVHHGDNIQYVQLADQLNGNNRNNVSFNSLPAEALVELTPTESATNDSNDVNNNSMQNHETFSNDNDQNNTNNTSNTSNNSNSNGSEDDIPLIQP